MDLEFKQKQSVLTKYYIDPDTKKPTTVPITEKQQVHPLKNLIQMVGEVKKNKKIQIIDRDMIAVSKPEKITQPYHYYVDYEQNLIHFHPDVAGQTIEYKYEDMGVTVISANKIFTKQDEKGNVVELLQEIIDLGREAIDVMLTIGGVAIIMKRLEDDIKEGYEISDKIQADIQQAKDEILNVRGNKEVIIKSSDWVLNDDIYEKEITHPCNSENLHVTAKNADTKKACTVGWQVLDKTRILLKSDEAINMSVILSASYYHATQTISDDIAEEVLKARKGETGLDVKITKIDEKLENNKNYLSNKINYITLIVTDYEHLKNDDDWTLAIEEAMKDLTSNGGGRLLIPINIKAKYIKLRSNITLEGLYKAITLEQVYNYDGDFITLLDENQINCNIRNLKILGFRTETKLPANNLIYLNNNDVEVSGEIDHYHNIENCCIESTNGNGIYVVKSRGVLINNNWVRKCNGNGIDVNASDNVITNNNVSLCKYGYTSSNDGGSALRMNNNKAFYCYTNFYFPPYCQNLMVSNCESQSAELHGFHLENCLNSNFNNLITDSEGRTQNNGVGVYIINCENCFISGIAREKHEGNQLSAIKTSGANKNISLDFKVATSKTPGYKDIIVEENASISNKYKINDIERNYSNIITYNPYTSNTLGYFENWTKTNSSGMNAKLSFKNNTQTIQIYENNTTIYNAIKLTSQEFVVNQYDKISFKVLAEQITSGLILKAEIVQYTSTNEAKDSRSVQTSALKQQVLEIDNYSVTDETVTKIKIILQCFANNTTGVTGYAKFKEPQLMIK